MANALKTKSHWAPAPIQLGRKMGCPGWKPSMGKMTSEDRQVMGIAILSALSIAGLHAAICPSVFTLMSFGTQAEARDRAMKGMWISLGLSTIASGGLYFVFDKWAPVVVAELTALALFGIGVWAIQEPTPSTIPPIEQQGTAGAPNPAAAAGVPVRQ